MPGTLHIRIKKEYAGALIEDLIKVNAVEMVEEDTIELNAEQRATTTVGLISNSVVLF